MSKLQKLDSKQMPQVIALSVICLGLVGWVGFQLLNPKSNAATVAIGEAVADPIDEHPLADLQRRDHRLAGDAVGLDQKRLDAEGEAQGNGDDDYELEERPAGRLLLGGH